MLRKLAIRMFLMGEYRHVWVEGEKRQYPGADVLGHHGCCDREKT